MDYNLNIRNKDIIEEEEERLFVHENFRLWFLSDLDTLSNIPGTNSRNIVNFIETKYLLLMLEPLIYDAIKITPQISDLSRTYSNCKEILSQIKSKSDVIKPETYLSLFLMAMACLLPPLIKNLCLKKVQGTKGEKSKAE